MYDTYGTADPKNRDPKGFQDFHLTADVSRWYSTINDLMNPLGFGGMGRQQMRNPRYLQLVVDTL